MIQMQTILVVADNSGAKRLRCIGLRRRLEGEICRTR